MIKKKSFLKKYIYLLYITPNENDPRDKTFARKLTVVRPDGGIIFCFVSLSVLRNVDGRERQLPWYRGRGRMLEDRENPYKCRVSFKVTVVIGGYPIYH